MSSEGRNPEPLTELDYFESARVIALYLDQWCDKGLIYPDMIADASRKVKSAYDELQRQLEFSKQDHKRSVLKLTEEIKQAEAKRKDVQRKFDALESRYKESIAEKDELQRKLEKWGNCLEWIKCGISGMFGSPDTTWVEDVENVPSEIDKVFSDEDWEGILNSQVARLRDENTRLREALQKIADHEGLGAQSIAKRALEGETY